jgi:hypothetical protein
MSNDEEKQSIAPLSFARRRWLTWYRRRIIRSAPVAMIAIALAVLYVWRVDELDTVIELRTELLEFVVADGGDGEDATLVFQDLTIRSVRVNGGERWKRGDSGWEAIDEAIQLTRSATIVPAPAAGLRASASDPDRSSGAVRSVRVAPGSTVTFNVTGTVLGVTLTPPDKVAAQPAVVEVSAGADWTICRDSCDADCRDPRHAPSTVPVAVMISGAPGRPLTFHADLDADIGTPRTIGVRQVRVSGLRVTDWVPPGERYVVSEVLSGAVAFSDMPRRNPEVVRAGERLLAGDYRGVFVSLDYVPASKKPRAGEPTGSHLNIVWNGVTQDLAIGYPGGSRSLSPSMLEYYMANASFTDLLGIATVIIGLFAIVYQR